MYLIRLFLAQLAEFPPSINSHLLCEFANLYGDKLPPHICLVSKESFWLLNEIVKRLERDLQPTQSKPKALPKKITPAIGFNIKRKLRYVGQKFYIKSCWIEIFTWNHVGQKFYIKSRWTELLHSYIFTFTKLHFNKPITSAPLNSNFTWFGFENRKRWWVFLNW